MMFIGVVSDMEEKEAEEPQIKRRLLPQYLAEFYYRFNRRFQLDRMLPRLDYIAVRTTHAPQVINAS
jgi:hypothetical protein